MARERKGKERLDGILLSSDFHSPPGKPSRPPLLSLPSPLEVDLGCGRGRLILARARNFPQRTFLGVDRLVRRLGKLNKHIGDEGLKNIHLVCGEALDTMEGILPPSSVERCYILFPDPWPKRKHHGRRLINNRFRDALIRVLAPGGEVQIATDHHDYFLDIVKQFQSDIRFESATPYYPTPDERTDFELIFIQQIQSINRCAFRKPASS